MYLRRIICRMTIDYETVFSLTVILSETCSVILSDTQCQHCYNVRDTLSHTVKLSQTHIVSHSHSLRSHSHTGTMYRSLKVKHSHCDTVIQPYTHTVRYALIQTFRHTMSNSHTVRVAHNHTFRNTISHCHTVKDSLSHIFRLSQTHICHTVTLSFAHTVTQSQCHTVSKSNIRIATQSYNYTLTQSDMQSSQCQTHNVKLSFSQSSTKSHCQTQSHSVNLSKNERRTQTH